MDSASQAGDARLGGGTAIIGAALMIAGAALWATSGADLDAALEKGTVGTYLTQAAESVTVLAANPGLWMLGVVLLAALGVVFARLSTVRLAFAQIAQGSYLISAGRWPWPPSPCGWTL